MHTATVVPSLHTKSELRTRSLQVRRTFTHALSPALRGDLEQQLLRRVFPHLGDATVVAAYSPMRDEIDPLPILEAVRATGRIAALPWFADRDARMMFRQAPAHRPRPWGVLQPDAQAPAAAPEIVLVPLVATDAACNRIGHGKGHYDRALAHLRESGDVKAIGLAWDIQIIDEAVPTDPWDIPLDAIATPDRWIERTTS